VPAFGDAVRLAFVVRVAAGVTSGSAASVFLVAARELALASRLGAGGATATAAVECGVGCGDWASVVLSAACAALARDVLALAGGFAGSTGGVVGLAVAASAAALVVRLRAGRACAISSSLKSRTSVIVAIDSFHPAEFRATARSSAVNHVSGLPGD
jgi:hypothetical protein